MLHWVKSKAVAAKIYARYGILKVRRGARQRANQRRLNREGGGVLTFHLESPVGLFAHLSWCLQIAAYCHPRGIVPRFVCTSPQYGDGGEDWFKMLFEQPKLAAFAPRVLENADAVQVREFEELPFYTQRLLTELTPAAKLQCEYFPVSPRLLAQADEFAQTNFPRGSTLGCHFRGTDKGIEAKRVAYETMTHCLHARLAKLGSNPVLFIATDEAAFIKHARSALNGVRVVSADVHRSTTGQALHLDPALRGRPQAEAALIDALLLARCDHLIKSPSALSAWSTLFNPQLGVTLVGRPFAHAMFFPENVLVEAGAELVETP